MFVTYMENMAFVDIEMKLPSTIVEGGRVRPEFLLCHNQNLW
jgi:hypothetical protein